MASTPPACGALDKSVRDAPLLEIASGAYEVGLTPSGGGVAYLRFQGVDVLRPAGESRDGPLGLSSFPLVPYANRIAHGQFTWGGRSVSLAPNFGDHPHCLHGDGWLAPWTAAQAGADLAILDLDREGGDWPWAYSARQTVQADREGVTFELELLNRAESAMPAGLGFHPYFPDRSDARLTANVESVWLASEDGLPTTAAAADTFGDWASGAPLRSTALIDHCHAGWAGLAAIVLPRQGLMVRMTASANLGYLHIYSPPGEDFFCVEPVSHRPDALNALDPIMQGVAALLPGARLRATMRLQVSTL